MNKLVWYIKQRYGSVNDFAEKELGIRYNTLNAQINNESMRYKDIKKILKILNLRFEDLEE